MTASPEAAPDYEESPDPIGQVAVDVDALRRRLDDQQVALRRNHQALSALAESVGKVVEAGRKRDRRAGFNSFVAYVLFTILIGGGAVLLYRSRAAELVRARNDAMTDLDAARKELQAVQKQLHDRDDAAAKAYAAYQRLEDAKRPDALDAAASLAGLPLTPTERDVLAAGEKQARGRMADAGVDAGADAVRRGDYAHALTELRRAVGYGAPSAALHYWLGVALVRSKDKDTAAAIDELRAALTMKTDQTDARYWLAQALDAAGRLPDARREYEKFAASQPLAPLAPAARQRWVELGQPGVRPGGVVPAIVPTRVAPAAQAPAAPAPAQPVPTPAPAPAAAAPAAQE